MISIKCFNGLPLEYESFLIKRYDSFVTTCRYIETFQTINDINYMLMHENDTLIELLIFDNKGNTSRCLNELVHIEQNIFAEFTKYIFKHYPAIKKIEIISSYNALSLNKSILFRSSDDFVISLPSTIDSYYLELGATTRQHVKNYKRRLIRDYPQVNFVTKMGTEIEEDIIDKIIQLNFDRIRHKGEIPNLNRSHVNDFFKHSQHYGCVSYIEIDGLIIAGCIAFMSGKSMSLYIIGHDNNFSQYNVGQLGLIYLIQTSIENGFSTCHLLWGEREYKTRFLAKPQPMNSYIVFKTYSLDFIFGKIREMRLHIFHKIRISKYAKPIKEIIKFYRRRKSLNQLKKNKGISFYLIIFLHAECSLFQIVAESKVVEF